jgi:hypothetical protein
MTSAAAICKSFWRQRNQPLSRTVAAAGACSEVKMMQMVHERTAQMSQHKPENGLQHFFGGFCHGGKSNPGGVREDRDFRRQPEWQSPFQGTTDTPHQEVSPLPCRNRLK